MSMWHLDKIWSKFAFRISEVEYILYVDAQIATRITFALSLLGILYVKLVDAFPTKILKKRAVIAKIE